MATKDELKGELDALGVEYPLNASKDELEALLADNQLEEEAESEEDNQSDDEADEGSEEEAESEEEDVETEVETEDATGETTRYGVYRGNSDNCVSVFTQENHGLDFKKLAEAKAKQLSEGGIDHEARPFVDPARPEPDKNVVNIVNKNNNLVRQFSLVTHGKDYRKFAEDFVAKYGEKKGLHIQS